MQKTYKVVLEKRVYKKDLQKIPDDICRKILARIQLLGQDPFPPGSKKLENYSPATYRIRQGVYRIVYRVIDDIVEVRVIKVGHRRDIYR